MSQNHYTYQLINEGGKMVNFAVAFRKSFTDWRKLVIGIALGFLPIIRWFVKGYIFESSGVGRVKPSTKMPEWSNMADLFIKGLVGTIISLAYMLPAIIVFVVGLGMTAVGLFRAFVGNVITIESINSVAKGIVPLDTIMPTITNNWPLAIPAILRFIPVLLAAAILGLLGKYLIPIAILHYVKSGKVVHAFDIGTVCRKAFTLDYLLAWIAVAAVSAVVYFILAFVLLIGISFAYFITGIFGYTLFGQVYREV